MTWYVTSFEWMKEIVARRATVHTALETIFKRTSYPVPEICATEKSLKCDMKQSSDSVLLGGTVPSYYVAFTHKSETSTHQNEYKTRQLLCIHGMHTTKTLFCHVIAMSVPMQLTCIRKGKLNRNDQALKRFSLSSLFLQFNREMNIATVSL